MDIRIRAAASVVFAAALVAAFPIAALADPIVEETITVSDPDGDTSASVTVTGSAPTISSTTVTTGGTTASATTTGTTATVSVPGTTATVGTVDGLTTPDTSGLATGTGTASVARTATLSGSGLSPSQTTLSTSLTNAGSQATVFLTDFERADQGAFADVSASEPVSRSSLGAAARANVLICLLSEASVDPTRVALSTLCVEDPSTAEGGIELAVANDITGTAIGSDAALRAAVCLLGVVTSPAPSSVTTSEIARASISTLCGSGPSTASATNGTELSQDRTGTELSVFPIIELASCLLANGTVGDPTIVQLSTICGSALGGMPSTADAAAPTQLSDSTSGTTLNAQPMANAAICILLDALAQLPSSSDEPIATVDISTACGTPTDAAPSTVNGESRVAANGQGGTTADIAPSVNAAICLLANAELALGGSSLRVADACAGTAALPPAGPASVEAGAGATTPTSEAVAGFEAAAQVPGLAGLPSSSTAALTGMGLVLASAAIALATMRRRR
jgi:hypothetical protein